MKVPGCLQVPKGLKACGSTQSLNHFWAHHFPGCIDIRFTLEVPLPSPNPGQASGLGPKAIISGQTRLSPVSSEGDLLLQLLQQSLLSPGRHTGLVHWQVQGNGQDPV